MAISLQDRSPTERPSGALGWKEQTVELLVFLFLIIPSLVLSLFVVQQGRVSFVFVAVSTILRDLALVCLILYFLWRNGESVVRLGWTMRQAWKEVMLGGALFVPFFVGNVVLERVLLRIGLSAPATPHPSFLEVQGNAEIVLGIVLVAVVALAEETIFRGYLLLRFQPLLRSSLGAIVLSSVIFPLGHGYEGSAGVVTVGVMGAIFALVYLWRGSLVAPIVMHFLQDFLGIVLLPLLGMK